MNACLGRVPPRSRSLLVCLNVLAFPFSGAKEPRSDTVLWLCMNISFSLLAFPECGLCMNVLNVSLSWPFQHFFVVCRSQCESPNILMFLFSTCAPILPDFVQYVSFYCFNSVAACLPGNTVLKLTVNRVCAISAKMCHFQWRMCEQRNYWLWLLIWQLLVARTQQARLACDTKVSNIFSPHTKTPM